MQIVATKQNGDFFRAQSVSESIEEQETVKTAMESDAGEELNFQVMSDVEFEQWLETH
jgi:hypothetical protein